jgi:hypothetical protein
VIAVRIHGAREVVQGLDRLDRRLDHPRRETFDALARRMVAALRQNLVSEGGHGGVSWPPLAASTVRERRRKGYGGKPRLQRTGRLLDSIRIVEVSDRRAFVAADADQAPVLDERFPFAGAAALDVESWVAFLADELDLEL